jgi:3,5-epimerase/4-reductase
MKTLIIGNGYLGKRCLESWDNAVMAEEKVYTVDDVIKLLDKHQPDTVLNAAGIVGKPNVDWCETHQVETIKGNTILPIVIAKACQQKNVYLLHIGTGCIFYGKSPHGGPWKENDSANPVAVYTRSKYAADLVLSTLPNVGIARIRMPIDSIFHPANLIDKLINFKQIVDVENSATVVEDMIEVFYQLLEKKAADIFHVTNPGSIKHREIIELYKKYTNSSHKCNWLREQELVDQGLAKKKRSNNVMASENLTKFGISMRPIKEAVEDVMKRFCDRDTIYSCRDKNNKVKN